MHLSDELVEQLKRHEGFRAHPYECSEGKVTIGFGRNLDDIGVSDAEADMLLKNDLDSATATAANWLSGIVLCPPRQAVVINMAFNLGGPKLGGFKLFKAALAGSNYDEAANQMLDSKWARQVGDRAIELATQMRSGQW
jgi:lysozyme